MGAVAPTKEHVDAIVTTTRLAIQRTRVRASVGVTRDGSMALVPASTTNRQGARRASHRSRRNPEEMTRRLDRRKILPKTPARARKGPSVRDEDLKEERGGRARGRFERRDRAIKNVLAGYYKLS
jgi:hypothetical protein